MPLLVSRGQEVPVPGLGSSRSWGLGEGCSGLDLFLSLVLKSSSCLFCEHGINSGTLEPEPVWFHGAGFDQITEALPRPGSSGGESFVPGHQGCGFDPCGAHAQVNQ